MPRVIIISLLLNYVVMGGIILLMARWLISNDELWAGFVVLAAVPPAVAVVPFSYVLGGDTLFLSSVWPGLIWQRWWSCRRRW